MAVINPTDWELASRYNCASCNKTLTNAEAYCGSNGIQCEDCFVKSEAADYLVHIELDNNSVVDLYV